MNRCYTESDVIAELRGWNEMSGDNDVVCVLWICVVVGTESYVCDQLPKLPEEPPPIGDCASSLASCLRSDFFSPWSRREMSVTSIFSTTLEAVRLASSVAAAGLLSSAPVRSTTLEAVRSEHW